MLENNRIGIEESKYFFCILSEHYLEDIEALECLLYAKNLGKPFIVLRDKTFIELPEIFKNVKIILNEVFDNTSEISDYVKNKLSMVLEREAESHDLV